MNKSLHFCLIIPVITLFFLTPNQGYSQEKICESLEKKISELEKSLKKEFMDEFKKVYKNFDKIEEIIREKENKEKILAHSISQNKKDSLEILRLKKELQDSSRIIQIRAELNRQISKVNMEKQETENKLNQQVNSLETKLRLYGKSLQNLDQSVRDWNQDDLINVQQTINLLGNNSSLSMQQLDDYFSLVKHINYGNKLMIKGFQSILEVKEYNAELSSFRDKYQAFPKLSSEFEKVSKLMGQYEGKITELDKLFKVVIADPQSVDFKRVNVLKPMHNYSDYPYLVQLIKNFSASPDKNPLEGKLK